MVRISVSAANNNRLILAFVVVALVAIILQVGVSFAQNVTNQTANSTANSIFNNTTSSHDYNTSNASASNTLTNTPNSTASCPIFIPPSLTSSNDPVAQGQSETLTEAFAWWDLSCLRDTAPFTYIFTVTNNVSGQNIANTTFISNSAVGSFTFTIPAVPAATGDLKAVATVKNTAQPQQHITSTNTILVCPAPATPFCLTNATVNLTLSNASIDQSQYETLTSTANVVGACYGVVGQCPETYTFYFQVENTTSGNIIASRLFPSVYNAIGSATEKFTFQIPQTNNALGPLHANVVVTYNPTCPYCAQNTTYPPISASNAINAHQAPTVRLLPSSATLTYGQNETFIASITGGSAPFSVVLRLGNTTIQSVNFTRYRNITFNSIVPPAGVDTYTVSGIDNATTPFYFTAQNTIYVSNIITSKDMFVSNSLVMQGQYENLSAAFSNSTVYPPYTLIFIATNSVTGNSIIDSLLTPMNTVYLGQNLTSGPFTVQLTDLGAPNSNGTSPATLSVYYNGTLTNTTTLYPVSTVHFTIGKRSMALVLNETFLGLYSYQKWAKMQLFSYSPNITVVSNTVPAGFTFQVPAMPDALGLINTAVRITGTGSNTTIYASNTFTSYPAFVRLYLMPSDSAPVLNSPDTFNAFFSGGNGPFSLSLLENGIVIQTINRTANGFPIPFNPVNATPIGNQSYAFAVTDLGLTTPARAQSVNTTVTVMPLPYSTLTVSNSIAAETQYESLTESFINYTLDSMPYTYTFTVTNSINGNVIANTVMTSNSKIASFLFALPSTSDALGILNANVVVADGATNVTIATGNTILSYPAPAFTFQADANSPISYGTHVNYTANITGGGSPFTLYVWEDGIKAQFVSNIITPNSIRFGYTPLAGIDNFTATAIDSGLTTPMLLTVSNTMATQPVFPLLVSNTAPQQGQPETLTESFTLNVLGPYIFNFTVSNALTGNVIAFNSMTSNTQSGASTFTIPSTSNAMGQMDAEAIVYSANAMIYIVYSTNTFTIIPTTPPPPPSGNGGGGGGSNNGGGGGGTFKPVVSQNASCYTVSDLAQMGQVAITQNGTIVVNITLNYITPDYAGVTVNGQSMQLNKTQPVKITNTLFTIELTGIQYLPILQTVTLGVCSTIPVRSANITTHNNATNSTNPTTTTVPVATNTITMSSNSALSPTGTVPNPLTQSVPFVGGFLLAGAGTSKLRKRMMRGKKHESYWKNDPKFVRMVEQAGIIEAATLAATVLLYYYGYVILSAIVAFAFGVSVAYFIDRLRSEERGIRHGYMRKEGTRAFIEEFGIVEIAAFAVAVYMYVMSQFVGSVIFVALFGLLFAYFVDRTREINTTIKGAAAIESLEPIGNAKDAKHQKKQQKKEEA